MRIPFQNNDIVVYAFTLLEAKVILEPSDRSFQRIEAIKSLFADMYEIPFTILLFVLLLGGFVTFLEVLFRMPTGRLSHSILYVVTSIFVAVEGVRCSINIPLVSLVSTGFFLAFVAELSALFDSKYGLVKKQKLVRKGFVSDNTQIDEEYVGWDKYADKLADRLVHTDVSNASFATALTGKWGTGKTTFLELLRKNLQGQDVIVVDFNPWMSDSSKMIVNDFFNTLKDALNGKDITVDKVIDKYVRLLVNWQNPSLQPLLTKWLGGEEKQGLQAARGQISEKLSQLDNPIFVFIDDTDRLQKEEILEVMKLIRNTANFCNVFYIVTFDKQYVVDSLEKAGITDSALYLKKIFQMELKFPMYEGYLFTHFLLHELEYYHQLEDAELRTYLSSIEMQIKESGVTIRDYFDNFRDVKRFVNEFLLILDYIEGQGLVRDFNLHDLFLTELLGYSDESTYNLLKTEPLEFLVDEENSSVFKLRADVHQKSKVSENTYNVLYAIFAQKLSFQRETDFAKMRRKNKFFTYFSLRPFAYQMGITEFLNILRFSSPEEIKAIIAKTNNGIFSKGNHLYELLLESRIRIMEKRRLSNYFVILEEWTKLNIHFDREKIVLLYDFILVSKLKEPSCTKVVNIAMKRIFSYLMQDFDVGCCLLQRILASMLNGKYIKKNNSYKTVLTCKNSYYSYTIIDFKGKCAQEFLEKVKPSIYSIYETGRLHEFIENTVIYSLSSEPGTPLMSSVEDELIEYFSKSKESNDYHKFFERFHYSNIERGDAIMDLEEMNDLGNDIKKYFVSLNFYVRFMQECFVYERIEILKNYLKKNYIG